MSLSTTLAGTPRAELCPSVSHSWAQISTSLADSTLDHGERLMQEVDYLRVPGSGLQCWRQEVNRWVILSRNDAGTGQGAFSYHLHGPVYQVTAHK